MPCKNGMLHKDWPIKSSKMGLVADNVGKTLNSISWFIMMFLYIYIYIYMMDKWEPILHVQTHLNLLKNLRAWHLKILKHMLHDCTCFFMSKLSADPRLPFNDLVILQNVWSSWRQKNPSGRMMGTPCTVAIQHIKTTYRSFVLMWILDT